MSHLKERKEKNCLNCGAEVQGKYCHVCGQENIEPKESFWHLVTHFMYDVTHFDGKFFSTLKYLLFRPGFLSHEYLRGRRASYLHPIRMYVFTSAFFFLIFFSVKKNEDVMKFESRPQSAAAIMKKLQKSKKVSQKLLDNPAIPEMTKIGMKTAVNNIDSDIALLQRDTTAKDKLKTVNDNGNEGMSIFGNTSKGLKSESAYDSAQQKLTLNDRDNFIMRRFAKQNIHLRAKYNNDSKAVMNAIIEKFKHFFPQMLFVSLPLFALLLQLLYARRKKFFYVNHIVFTIHMYCGTFIIILISMGVVGIYNLFRQVEPQWVGGVFSLIVFFFWYKSIRNFYEQRRGKTILKFLIVMFLSLLLMAFIFTLFFIFSAMAI